MKIITIRVVGRHSRNPMLTTSMAITDEIPAVHLDIPEHGPGTLQLDIEAEILNPDEGIKPPPADGTVVNAIAHLLQAATAAEPEHMQFWIDRALRELLGQDYAGMVADWVYPGAWNEGTPPPMEAGPSNTMMMPVVTPSA